MAAKKKGKAKAKAKKKTSRFLGMVSGAGPRRDKRIEQTLEYAHGKRKKRPKGTM